MAVTSTAQAEWHGTNTQGKGVMHFGKGKYDAEYTRASRFETGQGTNPEELLAAAHAGCFSMQFAALLTAIGHPPTSINTTANVTIEGGGVGITKSALSVEAVVPGIDEGQFQDTAKKAKENCPVSRALAGIKDISITAKLVPA
jgi:osmotically inducible protein OsmC